MTASDITIQMKGPYSDATLDEKQKHRCPSEGNAKVHENPERDRWGTTVECLAAQQHTGHSLENAGGR